jgi:hypothetical protein
VRCPAAQQPLLKQPHVNQEWSRFLVDRGGSRGIEQESRQRVHQHGHGDFAKPEALFDGRRSRRLSAAARSLDSHMRPNFGHPHAKCRPEELARIIGGNPQRRRRRAERENRRARRRREPKRRRAYRAQKLVER